MRSPGTTRGGITCIFTAGVERDLMLPAGMGLFLKVDGQIADQPLISHEEYIAGGMTNVRGYKEAEALGDDALHGTVELAAPDMGHLLGLGRRLQLHALYLLRLRLAGGDQSPPLPEGDLLPTGHGGRIQGGILRELVL